MEKLARFVDKEEKTWVKLIISAHVLERISHVVRTGSIPLCYGQILVMIGQLFVKIYSNIQAPYTSKFALLA
jgi:hypothetical protein